MNSKIKQLSDYIVCHTPKLIEDAEETIESSINAIVEASQESDPPKPIVLSIPVTLKWDMTTNELDLSLAISVRKKFVASGRMDDPNQQSLDLAEEDK